MNKKDLNKLISVVVLEDCYYGNRIRRNGETMSVKRYEFTPSCLVAVDEDGNPLKKQPKKLSTKAVKEAFAEGGEAFKEAEKGQSFPVISNTDVEEATNSGATELESSEEDVVESEEESTEGEGVASLV